MIHISPAVIRPAIDYRPESRSLFGLIQRRWRAVGKQQQLLEQVCYDVYILIGGSWLPKKGGEAASCK